MRCWQGSAAAADRTHKAEELLKPCASSHTCDARQFSPLTPWTLTLCPCGLTLPVCEQKGVVKEKMDVEQALQQSRQELEVYKKENKQLQ